jgi:hypothetical protein
MLLGLPEWYFHGLFEKKHATLKTRRATGKGKQIAFFVCAAVIERGERVFFSFAQDMRLALGWRLNDIDASAVHGKERDSHSRRGLSRGQRQSGNLKAL